MYVHVRMYIQASREGGIYMYVRMSLLERCPHFRGCYVCTNV